jgi:hypothetical protein
VSRGPALNPTAGLGDWTQLKLAATVGSAHHLRGRFKYTGQEKIRCVFLKMDNKKDKKCAIEIPLCCNRRLGSVNELSIRLPLAADNCVIFF